jgi:hypothetical protein
MPNELSFPLPPSFCDKTAKADLIIHFPARKSRKKQSVFSAFRLGYYCAEGELVTGR